MCKYYKNNKSHDSRYTTDGFAMLHRLITHLKGESTENKLIAVAELVAFNFEPNDTTSTYCARMRRLRTVLSSVTLDEIISLISISFFVCRPYFLQLNFFLRHNSKFTRTLNTCQ